MKVLSLSWIGKLAWCWNPEKKAAGGIEALAGDHRRNSFRDLQVRGARAPLPIFPALKQPPKLFLPRQTPPLRSINCRRRSLFPLFLIPQNDRPVAAPQLASAMPSAIPVIDSGQPTTDRGQSSRCRSPEDIQLLCFTTDKTSARASLLPEYASLSSPVSRRRGTSPRFL